MRQRIHRSLQAEARRLLGKTPSSILRYEKEYLKDFSGQRSPVTKAEIIRQIRAADVTFISDFHAFPQAQRTALRLMREATHASETWLIGVEFVASRFQAELDSFQERKIDETDFLKAIHYDEEWGFPWKNYAPILEFARENLIRVIALNRPAEIASLSANELEERDRWAAGIICDLFSSPPSRQIKPRMLVLYGELHVGQSHLPAQVEKISNLYLSRPLRSVSIHQNHDPLYWRLTKGGKDLQTDGIRTKKGVYCVFSSTPWVKLQSLVNWLEGEASEGDEDYLSLLRAFGQTLAKLLEMDTPSFESLEIATIHHPEFIDKISRARGAEARLIRFHVENNMRLYIPSMRTAYLGTPSQNAAAELAAIHLFHSKTGEPALFQQKRETVFRIALEGAFGFFGSLIVNPKRKCDLPSDHQKRLRSLRKGEKQAFPLEARARELGLALLHGLRSKGLLDQYLKKQKMAPALIVGARYAGQVLGAKLHHLFQAEKIGAREIHEIFFAPSEPRSYENSYQDLKRLVSAARLTPSKSDRL